MWAELTDTTKQVDLYRECPFWEENVFCMNRDCSIVTVDEVGTALDVAVSCSTCRQSEIPEQWRAGTLSKLERTEDHVSRHRLQCYTSR